MTEVLGAVNVQGGYSTITMTKGTLNLTVTATGLSQTGAGAVGVDVTADGGDWGDFRQLTEDFRVAYVAATVWGRPDVAAAWDHAREAYRHIREECAID